MSKLNSPLEFGCLIRETLADNPSWLYVVLQAIAGGMGDALDRANAQRAQCDGAMLAALILAAPGRISAETRRALNDTIKRTINPDGASAVEREFLERIENAEVD